MMLAVTAQNPSVNESLPPDAAANNLPKHEESNPSSANECSTSDAITKDMSSKDVLPCDQTIHDACIIINTEDINETK